ncbi:hypothetical protein [Sutcliffiella rhizosphaerae]|uniref:Aminoglycoside phosphotransferase domain-containing protein n=1 Tax=Sutcliffiella rhizosphaerae TaxID=2880967 RepID=A0ABM8YR47_9BACI|nr:hypothetical protein [Sutcliffiella rhizosphaerae]CAG9622304.1 hypothetical protein BACCIP111883_03095 [Sutcliffiella rhizosphaerae]
MEKMNQIVDLLRNNDLLEDGSIELKRLKSGTTNGVLYTIIVNKKPTYVVKIDDPKIIIPTQEFFHAYKEVKLLPNVLYADETKEYIVYTHIPGQTHVNRGSKVAWMTILIKQLFNNYKRIEKDIPWGRVNGIPRKSWSDFNQSSLEIAKENIGNLFPEKEHKRVEGLVNEMKKYHSYDEKFYLHGDAGVHNLVY